MIIVKGSKFKVHWKGHESCYQGRTFKVISIIKDCTCPDPNNFINGKADSPRQSHSHITAKLIEVPKGLEYMMEGSTNKFWFNGYCDKTLKHIQDPNNDRIEIINSEIPLQLELF